MDFLLTWSNTNFPLVDLPLFSFSFAALLALLPSLLPLGVCGRGGKGGGGLGLGRGQHWGGGTTQGGSMLERMKGPTGEEACWAKGSGRVWTKPIGTLLKKPNPSNGLN
jgi:hypothetical protein